MSVIAIEEHYWGRELASHFTASKPVSRETPAGSRWISEPCGSRKWTDAGIDIQVLSHGAPSAQKIGADIAVGAERRVNDRLHTIAGVLSVAVAGFLARDPGRGRRTERCVVTLGSRAP